jgi:KUP system potassium uptake protein
MRIVHTSEATKGQIYMPEINTALWGRMHRARAQFSQRGRPREHLRRRGHRHDVRDVDLFIIVARDAVALADVAGSGARHALPRVDLAFLARQRAQDPSGGWVPLVVAGLVFVLMSTWKLGRKRLSPSSPRTRCRSSCSCPTWASATCPACRHGGVPDIGGLRSPAGALLHHLKHNKVLHERVLVMSVSSAEIPQVGDDERITCEPLGQGFYLVKARLRLHGNARRAQGAGAAAGRSCRSRGTTRPPFKVQDTSFYLGRETLIVSRKALKADAKFFRMMRWRRKLFALMSRNAQSATAFFQLPPNRVVELGRRSQF